MNSYLRSLLKNVIVLSRAAANHSLAPYTKAGLGLAIQQLVNVKGSGVFLPLSSVLGLVRFHIGPEEGIDSRLIAGAFCLKPLQYLLIEPDRDRRLRLRQPEDRALEEGFPLLRDTGSINDLGVHTDCTDVNNAQTK